MKEGPSNAWAKYSQIGIQMGAIIGLFVWGGVWLDDNYNDGKDLWKIILSLAGIFIALFTAIRDVMRFNKKK